MKPESIGIIGYGAFGAFTHELITRFLPGVTVRVFSRTHPADGRTFVSFEDACQSGAVVFAVPIRAFEDTLVRALPHIPEGSLLIDVATVKAYTAGLLARHAGTRRYVATHPMFGPESYAKTGGDMSGYRLVIADHTLSANDYATARAFLASAGIVTVEMTPDEHDRQLAETLFLTHFIGQVMSRAGFGRTEIDTVSFSFLLKAVEIVRVNTELFRDVYRFNPYCEPALARFEAAEADVHALLERVRRTGDVIS
jgi:prephenate dehydrogenase